MSTVGLGALALGAAIVARLSDSGGERASGREEVPVPVAVVPVETGSIALRRVFSATLEAPAHFAVAPKVAGRVERLLVDLADPVQRGQVVAELDNDAYEQEVAAAEADLAVARANLTDARNTLVVAQRTHERTRALFARGIASESQLDTAHAEQLSQASRVEVAKAQITRAEAALAGARIRLGYTSVRADWTGGDEQRVVGARYVDAGDTVAANAELLLVVELDPVLGVFHVTEDSYARLHVGQAVELATDAYPDEAFTGRVARIAPIFQEGSRQARVELTVPNPGGRLKPGMFARAAVVLERIEDATIVPAQAITRRQDRDGVFLLDEARMVARWRPVALGIREGDRVQVSGRGLAGRVVTLGAQMAADGAAVTVPEQPAEREPDAEGRREVPGR